MRTSLPVGRVHRNENGIVNLDNVEGSGTHWVAYAKRRNRAIYFDNLTIFEGIDAVSREQRDENRVFNHMSYQHYNQNNCGQLCLQFLRTIDNQFKERHCAV